MNDTATVDQGQPASQTQPDISQLLAASLWTGVVPEQPAVPPADATPPVPPQGTNDNAAQAAAAEPAEQSIDVDEYFKKEFGLDAAAAKAEWEALRKLKETPPASPEIKFANDDSRNFFQLLAEGKEDDLYSFLNQKKQIERLEKLSIANTSEAAEILRANLQFKNKNLSKEDVEFMVEESYQKPQRPAQALEESDTEFAAREKSWEEQVARIDRKMIIDAKLAQNEIPGYKSQIVLPDIPKAAEVQQQNQKELDDATQKAIEKYQKAIQENYQNFKGFSTTAKDGDVQLPINYAITPEELIASRETLQSFNLDQFVEQRWFDENNNPKITQIQEDLYLLHNRDKILQSIATEAASQSSLHRLKAQNNINLSGVNPNLGPPNPPITKSESEVLAEQLWKF